MTYPAAHNFDVSIVTRLRLRTWCGVSPSVRAGVTAGAIFGGLALLHLVAGLLFITNTASGQAAGLDRLPLDEAWARLVYARSFAQGFTLDYNPGSAEGGATSPLWVMMVGLTYKALAFTGVGLPAVAKLLGLVLALATSLVVLKLVQRVTGSTMLGVAAGALIALEPAYSYAKVSGTEVSLFGFLALGAAAAFYQQRLTLTGVLLALAVAARPEGLLLAALALAALGLKVLWERGDFRLMSRQDLAAVCRVAVPPALAGLAIALYYLLINGTPYPNSYLAGHIALTPLNAPNLWHLAQGYLAPTGFFGVPGVVATLPLLLLAAVRYIRQSRFAALPLIAFPPVLCYALTVVLPLDPAPWDITLRRLLDPTLPFILVGLVVGLHCARRLLVSLGMRLRRAPPDPEDISRPLGLPAGSTGARWAGLALALLFLVLAALPLVAVPGRWVSLTGDYSWSSRAGHQVDVAAAHWIQQNLPADAVVGTPDVPGALRFFGGRRVVDLSGVNTHTAIGRPLFDAAQAHRVDYLVAFRNIYLDSWPLAEEIMSFPTQPGVALPGPQLVVYRANWDRSVDFADKTVPHSIDTAELRLLDWLDVGVRAQEEAHHYSLSRPSGLVERIFNVAQDGDSRVVIRDQGRTTTGMEEFVSRSEPGRPLIIAKRYDAAVGGSVAVYVDGSFVGDWQLAPRDFVFGEDTFRVGRELITGTTTHLRFQHLPGPGATLNSFYYWVYTTD